MKLTKREKELLLNAVVSSILYQGWNFRIKDVYNSKGSKTDNIIIIPDWIKKDDEDFGKKELFITVKSPYEYVVRNVLDKEGDFEKVYSSIMALLYGIKGYYNLED